MRKNVKVILLTVAFCCLSLTTFSQSISLILRDVTIKEAIQALKEKTGYSFVYEVNDIDTQRKISINARNKPVEEVVKQILSGQKVNFVIQEKNIVITRNQQALTDKENSSKRVPKRISGLISDEKGEPIIGATIIESSSNKGTVTDYNGQFSLETDADAQLKVSYIGYESQTVHIAGRTSLKISMSQALKQLDEVIVIGYGTVKKSDLTGAVSSIKTDDLPLSSNASIATMLSGRAAGVVSRQVSAQPGGGVEILIRGAASTGAGNEPLYIIDGFPIGSEGVEPAASNKYSDFGSRSPLNSINPNDIESIEILKDASSSAIYGARAANGVILITTKKGKAGKSSVSYNGSYGIQRIANRIEMMDATQYMMEANAFSREKWLFDNRMYPYGTTSVGTVKPWTPVYLESDIQKAGKGTDWYSLITQDGMINQHNLSISGGSEKLKHMISLNYFDQQGVVKNSSFTRFSGRANISQELSKIFSYGINATISYVNNTNVPLGREDFENSGLINSALAYDPTIPVKDDKGNYFISPTMPIVPNPVSMLEITDYTKNMRFLINGFVQANLYKGLTAKVNMGIDDQRGTRYSYLPKTTLYGLQDGGNASKNSVQRFDRLLETTLIYELKINEDHKFNVLAGYSYQDFNLEFTTAQNNKFFTDVFLYNSLSSGEADRPFVSSGKSENKLISYFGRVNYSLLDKYLLTITARNDGSSNFGVNNRFAFFPSAAVAWRINQEDFLKESTRLSNLKLRVGVGQTGNSNIGAGAFEYYTSAWQEAVFGKRVYTGTAKSQMANPDLKWETTTEINTGIDFGFFNERISGSVDYFYKQIKDLLGYRTLKSFMEVSTVAANIGKTQSQGFEVTLRTDNLNRTQLKWNTEFTFTRYVDRWLERNPELNLNPWQKNDDPIRAYYTYLADGILTIGETPPSHMPNLLPGQFKVKDVNGYVRDEFGNLIPGEDGKIQYLGTPDGILDQADIVLFGTSDPGFSVGLGNAFEYKGFDLNIFFYGMFDRLVYNQTREKYSIPEIRRILSGQNFMAEVTERWSSTNPNSELPSGFVTTYPQPGTYLWEEGWFIRCKNITVGYTLPSKWLKNFASKARFFVDLGNPFVITAYTGNDPETDFKAGYPNQHSLLAGFDITF